MKRKRQSAEVLDSATTDGSRALAERPWLRRLIGLAILWHVTAVAIAPWAVLTARFRGRAEPPGGGPPRPTIRDGATAKNGNLQVRQEMPLLKVANLFQPYLNLFYLNHGYSFFAPEPGPSYVISYEVERQDGVTIPGRLPDLQQHRPRLLYHRYFMLATQNPELMAEAEARGKVEPGSTETLAHAIAEHLNRIHDGKTTTLRLSVHRLLWPEEVLSGKSAEAPETYATVGEIQFPPETRMSPDGSQAGVEAGVRLEAIPSAEETLP